MATPPSYRAELEREQRAARLAPREPLTRRVREAALGLPSYEYPEELLQSAPEYVDEPPSYTEAVARGLQLAPVTSRSPGSYAKAARMAREEPEATPWSEAREALIGGLPSSARRRAQATPPLFDETLISEAPALVDRPDIVKLVQEEQQRRHSEYAPTERGGYMPPAVLETMQAPATLRVVQPVAVRPTPISFREERQACTRAVAEKALARHGGNKSAAARELGLSREGLYGIVSDSPYYQARRASGRA